MFLTSTGVSPLTTSSVSSVNVCLPTVKASLLPIPTIFSYFSALETFAVSSTVVPSNLSSTL